MAYVFRTDGPWGPGLGQNLTPDQVDSNFWQAVQDIQAKAPQGVGIAGFSITGNQLTVVMTDHTLMGPYTLPVVGVRFLGEWQANYSYFVNDIFTANGSTYIVLINHLSAATFDPGVNDGDGHDFYGLLLENPAMIIPDGGAVGAFLRKTTLADFAMAWQTAALATDLSDVSVIAPVTGEVLQFENGIWQNLPLPDGLTMALSNLTDVALTTPAAGQPLVFDGAKWIDAVTVDMPCGGLNTVSGSITLDRSTGEVQRLILASTVTLTSIIGWPPGGQFARLVLEIQNPGIFGFGWPSGVLWPNGIAPAATANGKDVYILISFDGGTTIYGNIAGQNFM